MFIFWSVIYSAFIVCLVVGSAPYASGSGKYFNKSSYIIALLHIFVEKYDLFRHP